jgi:chromosome partitioning protein
MAKVLSVFSHKGGVGKTTVSVNLAAAFALMLSHENPEKAKRVLLIDLDEQAHSATLLSNGFFGAKNHQDLNSLDNIADLLMLTTNKPVSNIIQTSHIPLHARRNLDYIPSNRAKMTRVETNLQNSRSDALYRLEKILMPIRDYYEYIIIDNPPGINFVNLNGLISATHALVVTQLETPAINSLNNALHTIESIQQKYNSSLIFSGILPNMCDFRISEHKDYLVTLQKHYREIILPHISRRADITYATSRGFDIFSHKPPRSKREIESKNSSAIEFAILATDIRKRLDTWTTPMKMDLKDYYVKATQ